LHIGIELAEGVVVEHEHVGGPDVGAVEDHLLDACPLDGVPDDTFVLVVESVPPGEADGAEVLVEVLDAVDVYLLVNHVHAYDRRDGH